MVILVLPNLTFKRININIKRLMSSIVVYLKSFFYLQSKFHIIMSNNLDCSNQYYGLFPNVYTQHNISFCMFLKSFMQPSLVVNPILKSLQSVQFILYTTLFSYTSNVCSCAVVQLP